MLAKSQLRALLFEGSWVFVGQAVAAIGAVVLVWLLSHNLSPEAYGVLSLALTLSALVNQTLTGAVAAAAARYYTICAPKGEWGAFLQALGRLFAYALAGVAIVLVLSLWLFSGGDRLPIGMVVCALLMSVVSGLNATVGGIQTAARRRATAAFFSAVDSWSKVLCSCLIVWLALQSSLSILAGLLVASVLVAALQVAWLLRVHSRAPRPDVGRSLRDQGHLTRLMLAYAWPFNVWGFFSWIQQSSDRWALEVFGSTAEVGVYSVLLQIAYLPMTMLGNMACLLAGPILFGRASSACNNGNSDKVSRVTWLVSFALIAASAGAALVGGLLGHEISGLLTGPAFRDEVAAWLAPVFFAGGMFAAGQFLSLRLMAEMQSRRILWVKFATAVAGLGMNLTGAFFYGLPGVVFAAVVFSILHYLGMSVACLVAGKNARNTVASYEEIPH